MNFYLLMIEKIKINLDIFKNYRIGRTVIFITFLFTAFTLYAQNLQKIIPIDSDIYTLVDNLYLEQGLARTSTSKPWSEDELLFILNKINKSKLTDAGKTGLQKIEIELYDYDKNTGPVKFRSSTDINLEAYYKIEFAESGTEDSDYEWLHGYKERLPLINIPLEFELGNNFYSSVDLTFKDEPNVLDEFETKASNIIINPMHLNMQFPFRSFLSTGSENWNIQFGRDKLSWGNGYTGNLVLSDSSEYYDFLKASTWWGKFKFTTVYASLEPWLTTEEEAAGTGIVKTKDGSEFEEELYKAFFGHRLEYYISSKLNIALSESVIFGRKYPDMQDFNPLMIFHNWYIPEQANSMISLEINYVPLKNISLYTQIAVDQFQTSGEKEAYASADSQPNAFGILSGIKALKPLSRGYLSGIFEWIYTNPWMYTGTHPLLSYTSRWRVISNVDGDSGYKFYDNPIGYYTGPDSQVFYININYSVPDDYSASFEASYLQKGENTIYTLYGSGDDPVSLKTPSGKNPIHKIINKVNGEKKINQNFMVGCSFYWGWEYNLNHINNASRQSIELIPYLSFNY